VDDEVEQFFHTALSQKFQVEFLGDAEWYIEIKFDWHRFSDGTLTCRLSQEGYASAIVEEMGLSSANKCPMMTPFYSGFPIDAIPHVDMTPEEHAPLIAKMQCWLGMIIWLQQCTRPDLATIFSLLATHMHCSSLSHLEATKYVGRYILSTLELGLVFSKRSTSSLETFIHFLYQTCLLSSTILRLQCSVMQTGDPKMSPTPLLPTFAQCPFTSQNQFVVIYFFYGGCRILWKTHKEARISRSSCKAQIKATYKCIKNIQMFRHILTDLGLAPHQPTPLYNDNRGAVEWSNSFSTKGMCHLNIRENAVREAQLMQEVFISHISGTCNPADIFTKEFKSDCTFRSL
jgi:hypothetical protein